MFVIELYIHARLIYTSVQTDINKQQTTCASEQVGAGRSLLNTLILLGGGGNRLAFLAAFAQAAMYSPAIFKSSGGTRPYAPPFETRVPSFLGGKAGRLERMRADSMRAKALYNVKQKSRFWNCLREWNVLMIFFSFLFSYRL